MTAKPFPAKKTLVAAAVAVVLAFLGYVYGGPLLPKAVSAYRLVTDRELVKEFVLSFGAWSPVVFMGIQVLQVLLAPFPGEATGFVGGYLFGTLQGFLYSSMGLTLGSLINFSVGRFLGEGYIRRHIPPAHLRRLDNTVRRQGVIVVFALFVFPGFPKDYLCLFLGLTAIPVRVFAVLAVFGRMPGTLMLSLQGALVFEKDYTWFILILGICLILVFSAYLCRNGLYRWLERVNGR